MFDTQSLQTRPDHAVCSVEVGLHILQAIKDVRSTTSVSNLEMRIGIHSGSVMCGVLGDKKWHFDVWSEDVIIANHMERLGIPGRIHISEATHKCLHGAYDVEPGEAELRDKHWREMNILTHFITKTEPLLNKKGKLVHRDSNQIRWQSSETRGEHSNWTPESPFQNVSFCFLSDVFFHTNFLGNT